MIAPLQPTSLEELAAAVRAVPHIIPVGAGTKPRLSSGTNATLLSTTRLSGIIEYEPSEYTFTAFAGTPLRDINAALAERGQYLPFDPPLAKAGATLGGTVAAGLNGPGRLRFGGVRDFILGVRFVDGEGRLLRLGGKVVKNAAGFDLPKFFVGSLGRYGVLGEITFKVFPCAASTFTMEFSSGNDAELCQQLSRLAQGRWELDALEASPLEGKITARLAGPPDALKLLAVDLARLWPARLLTALEAQTFWQSAADIGWAHENGALCKIPLTLDQLPRLAAWTRTRENWRCRVSSGGNAAWLSFPHETLDTALDATLRELGLSGLLLRGDGPLWLGVQTDFKVQAAVKQALDPVNRFPALR